MPTHIHIDAVGGLSGDMFIASMLDTFPNLYEAMHNDLETAGILEHVSIQQTQALANGISAGSVEFLPVSSNPRPTHHYKHIKQRLETSSLNRKVLQRSIAIFELLAAAEAKVHAVAIEDVHFHEIADWDSQADIVGAASLIEHANIESWSCYSLPLGGGFVKTEHGLLPVPAPATTELLHGFSFHDDGEQGERVTPTGAAILSYLIASDRHHFPGLLKPNAQLLTSGTGCGKKRFDTVPNITRLLAYKLTDDSSHHTNEHLHTDNVGVINFEIDDMTPEELATGIDYIRASSGIIDVSHHVRVGKKNRSLFSIQILHEPEYREQTIEACFLQTTTLGLRTSHSARTILRRTKLDVTTNGKSLPIKQTKRPNGISSTKIEADALLGYTTLIERRQIAIDAEQDAQNIDE